MTTQIEELRKKCLDLAKDSQLSAELVLLVATLYADEKERLFIASIIMSETDMDKVPQYNYHMAAKKGPAFLAQYGDLLTNFQLPLFPPDEAYDLLNSKLLRDYVTPTGGAP